MINQIQTQLKTKQNALKHEAASKKSCLHYKNQLVNAAMENDGCLSRKS
jgi:hypothetical protein